ncbi:MAG: ABC transporter ATP-binding protein [Syntrophorhabdales bacterium]|jgi:branched-chain amino acid transport system ATP-binding protein
MLMRISDLHVAYGAISALDGITMEMRKGEILSIIGANGAGKSTLLRTVTGILRPVSGEIEFAGRSITRRRPDRIVRLGISMVPEGRQIFPDLTVRENLEVGGHVLRGRRARHVRLGMVLHTFPRLKERLRQSAGTLSGGEQQMLALGRALMANPDLLLLDEPSMGLSPIITREIFSLIETINKEEGISIMLVEQNAHMALDCSNRAYVLETGRIVMEGSSADIKRSPVIVEAYLGGFEAMEE